MDKVGVQWYTDCPRHKKYQLISYRELNWSGPTMATVTEWSRNHLPSHDAKDAQCLLMTTHYLLNEPSHFT